MDSVMSFMKRLLIHVLHRSAARPPCAPCELRTDSLKRILVVRQHDQLGDLLISTPAIRALRHRFPDAFIAVVVRDYTKAMMENNPNIDKLIVFHDALKRWSWMDAREFWRDLRGGGGFDCAVVLNTVSRSSSSDLIALLSRARYIVGPDHIKLAAGLPERIYNVVTHRDRSKKTEIEHNLDIVRALGAVPDSLEYDLVPTNEERLEAEEVFRSLSIERSGLVVGVHFGTLSVSRRFPLERLAEVIDALISKYEAEVVLIVGPHEVELRKYLLSLLSHRVHSAPLMPIRVSAAFMTHLDLFLCNDTGTLHIASSQRTPTVSFHGLNDPAVWKPPHERHFPVIAADRIITSITVQQTMAVIAKAVDYVACSTRPRTPIPEHRER
jgi:ADP-heptose:LPS heptosyltransferase